MQNQDQSSIKTQQIVIQGQAKEKQQIPKPQGDDQQQDRQSIQNQTPQSAQQVQGQAINPQMQAQQLIQNVQMLNQQKAIALQSGQQPNPQIDQQILQNQMMYQQLMQQYPQLQQQMQQQQQQQQQQNRQFNIGNPNQNKTARNPNLTEKQARQLKREQMMSKTKYQRPLIPESNEENMDLGGSYQRCLFRLGECCGTLRSICPCLVCVNYPFVQVDQGEEGIYQRFGKFVKTVKAGLHQVNPFTDKMIKFSTKQITYDMHKQFCITKDNILVQVDGQLFYRIVEPRYAQYYTNDIQACVVQLAYTTVRTVIGHFILQDLFEKKDELTEAIQTFIEDHVWEWGVTINSVIIKEVTASADVTDCLNAAAKERRLAESKIISAKADVQSAKLMREAADILDSDAAMQIRYLETISKLSQTSKIILLGEDEN